jgi:tyrosine-protein kinase Etk/Wzc
LQLLACQATNNIISFLGITPGVGKSFITANFSYLLAESNKRVLLIDGDIRRGYLHNYFQCPRAPGLMELIKGETTIDKALQSTQHPNLTFLPTGVFPDNPAEVLMSSQFKEWIKIFSSQFDFVIFDTPPILLVTDAALIAALSSINFLIIGSHRHQPEEIEIAVKKFSNAGIVLNGSIFNYLKSEPKGIKGYGKYNYYNYNYNYETMK